jgi:hypothetical protein
MGHSPGENRPRRRNTSTTPRPLLFEGHQVLPALGRLLLQGALRVVLVAVTTACVVGFMSIVAASSQAPEPALASAKEPSKSCMPSRCRVKVENRATR